MRSWLVSVREWFRPHRDAAATAGPRPFPDRHAAGVSLAAALRAEAGPDVVVLGLPRGGVVVAGAVAELLEAPLDVIVVRKLGVPWQPELAFGALGEDGVEVLDQRVIRGAGVLADAVAETARRERTVLESRAADLRARRPRIDLAGRIAIVVDDGVATGSTARAACQVARRLGADRVVLAVPVGPADTVARFPLADKVVCLVASDDFSSVGQFYGDFSATTDAEVIRLLDDASRRRDPEPS